MTVRNQYILSSSAILMLVCASMIMAACSPKPQKAESLHTDATIWPDYADVLLPANIAPPTFVLCNGTSLTSLQAVFRAGEHTVTVASHGEAGFCIDEGEWEELKHSSDTLFIYIQGKKGERWVEYNPINMYISADSIDPYLTYRLIEPGYEVWNEMGIYQRCLENYEEKAFLTNNMTDGGCMNCHSFRNQNADTMLFHLRADYSGTYVMRNGILEKLNPTFIDSPSALVYPSWHPSGDYIAFSVNNTKQMFHTTDRNRIEVFDFSSDIVLYDVRHNTVTKVPQLHSSSAFETFPSFSPDGRILYFCSADSVLMPDGYENVHYSLCSIKFDSKTGLFGTDVDTLYNAHTNNKSVSFPRVSPDGNYMVFTLSSYGNFSIWHKDADLWIMDLSADDRTAQPLASANSLNTESYHSWSSNSRWLVFSSRRDDGLYTRPYITHIDKYGHASKPFIMPAITASYYNYLMKSYNIPEFTRNRLSDMPQLPGKR